MKNARAGNVTNKLHNHFAPHFTLIKRHKFCAKTEQLIEL